MKTDPIFAKQFGPNILWRALTSGPMVQLVPTPQAIATLREVVCQSAALLLALDRIGQAGGRPHVVGGAVRDALLGIAPKDLDIECHAISFGALGACLEAVGEVKRTGAEFGVLKLVIEDGSEVDFSLPRREVKTGVGHRDFEVIVDSTLSVDVATMRRDFTINALMIDLTTKALVDPHNGLADLNDGLLRHVSLAFSEDPLRVLRAAQFAARFGLRLHPDTVELCRSIADHYEHLPAERVWGEFQKILRYGSQPSLAIDVLIQTEWIRNFPELDAIVGVPQDAIWHPEGTVEIHSALSADAAVAVATANNLSIDDRMFVVTAALLHDLGKATHTQVREDGRITAHGHASAGVEPAEALLRRIGAPGSLIERVLPVIREHMCCISTEQPSAAAVRRLARRLVPASIVDWSYVVEADNRGRGPASRPGCAGPWLEKARKYNVEHEPAQPILRGTHLIKAGMPPGPLFRAILDDARVAQESGEFDDEASALIWLSARLMQDSN